SAARTAEARADDGTLGREDVAVTNLRGALRDGAGKSVRERQLGIACELENRIDLRPAHGGMAQLAAQPRRQDQLPLGARAHEPFAGRAGAVAQTRTSRPEIDARRFRLCRVVFPWRRRPFGPTPGPD